VAHTYVTEQTHYSHSAEVMQLSPVHGMKSASPTTAAALAKARAAGADTEMSEAEMSGSDSAAATYWGSQVCLCVILCACAE